MKPVVLILLFVSLTSGAFAQGKSKANAIIQEAFQYMDEGENKKALEVFNQAIKDYPNRAIWHLLKGELIADVERPQFSGDSVRYQQALEQFNKAIELAPANPKAYTSRALLHFYHQYFNKAIDDYTRVLQFASPYDTATRFYAHNDRGAAYSYQGKLNAAVADYKSALDIRPGAMGVYANLGTLLMNQGNYKEAEQLYETGLAYDSSSVPLKNNLGLLYVKTERYQQAISLFNQLLDDYPKDAFILNNMGLARLKTGDLRKAGKLIRKSIKLYSKNAAAYKNRALYYKAKGKTTKACENLQKARSISREPNPEVMDLIEELGC